MIEWLKQQYTKILSNAFPILPSYILRDCRNKFEGIYDFGRITKDKRFNYVFGNGFTDYMMHLTTTEVLIIMTIIEEMKERIPKDPVLKEQLERLIDEGLSKEEALDVMIVAWLDCIIKR